MGWCSSVIHTRIYKKIPSRLRTRGTVTEKPSKKVAILNANNSLDDFLYDMPIDLKDVPHSGLRYCILW